MQCYKSQEEAATPNGNSEPYAIWGTGMSASGHLGALEGVVEQRSREEDDRRRQLAQATDDTEREELQHSFRLQNRDLQRREIANGATSFLVPAFTKPVPLSNLEEFRLVLVNPRSHDQKVRVDVTLSVALDVDREHSLFSKAQAGSKQKDTWDYWMSLWTQPGLPLSEEPYLRNLESELDIEVGRPQGFAPV